MGIVLKGPLWYNEGEPKHGRNIHNLIEESLVV